MAKVAILVAKDITVIEHSLSEPEVEHLTIEILPNKRGRKSTFVVNTYKPLRPAKAHFTNLLSEASRLAHGNQLIVVGDFNSPHRDWWYQSNSARGSDGKANHTLQLLKTTTQQISKTFCFWPGGQKQKKHAGGGYDPFDFNKANAIIGVACKNALGLPPYTSNVSVEALGLHNTLAEIQEAVLLSQRECLLSTATGRHILKRIGYPADLDAIQSTTNIPTSYRARVHVAPVPKNMSQ
ncbi:hypothetical protein HPB49_009742 [Dermacentor silvarum]|uniref:Uncharacterized protein n=1 Tax=Dermacentor silvarum TaxID=543639 RepID=A0ACB8DNH4_DERSI|nr:hypothetical protein HPB49_009742 [Dermacentor silvarum]